MLKYAWKTAQATTLSRAQKCNRLTGQCSQKHKLELASWQHCWPQFANKKSWPNPALQRARKRIVWLLLFTTPVSSLSRGDRHFFPILCFCIMLHFLLRICVCVCVCYAPPFVHTNTYSHTSDFCLQTAGTPFIHTVFFVVRKNMILNKFKMHLLMCARCILCILCFARLADWLRREGGKKCRKPQQNRTGARILVADRWHRTPLYFQAGATETGLTGTMAGV